MSIPNNPDLISALLREPSNALLRKFGSLGYMLMLRLQTELTAIEKNGGKAALVTHIDLHKGEATENTSAAEESQEEKQLVTDLQCKLISYCKQLNLDSAHSSHVEETVIMQPFLNYMHFGHILLSSNNRQTRY